MERKKQLVYYVVSVVTKYKNFEDARTKAPELMLLTWHVRKSCTSKVL